MRRILFSLFVALYPTLIAVAQTTPYIPPELKNWVDWVSERHPEWRCSIGDDGTAQCVWPGKLTIDVTNSGATFDYRFALDKRTAVQLPGGIRANNDNIWPLELKLEGGAAGGQFAVTELDGRPEATLERGFYRITGKFNWSSMPEFIPIPLGVGMLSLSINGSRVDNPRLTDRGELWLREAEQNVTEEDRLDVSVYRMASDGNPFRLETRLELRISGKPRELALPQLLPSGFQPISISSPLSFTLDPNYRLTVQARSGVHTISIAALNKSSVQEIQGGVEKVDGWPESETWVWIPDEQLRSVDVEGGTPVDPSQTALPPEWRQYQAYVLGNDVAFKLTEKRRGLTESAPNDLRLQRVFYLDLDGEGFTVRDTISGTMYSGFRLDVTEPTKLGRALVNGSEQLITENPETKLRGVELRDSSINLQSDSRLDVTSKSIPAVSWNHDINQLSVQLMLPPGYTLFHASGVDNEGYTWLSSWSLLDLFLTLLVSLSAYKLIGRAGGLAAIVALVLTHQKAGVPLTLWIAILVLIAITRELKPGGFKSFLERIRVLLVAILIFILVPFVLSEVQFGLFPQTKLGFSSNMWRGLSEGYSDAVSNLAPQADTFLNEAVAPAPQSAPASIAMEIGEEQDLGVVAKSGGSLSSASRMRRNLSAQLGRGDSERKFKATQQVDPKSIVQTGPGLPNWSWQSYYLSWSGPVARDHSFSLCIISPTMNLLLTLIEVISLTILALLCLKNSGFGSTVWGAASKAAAVGLILLFPIHQSSAQDSSFPSSKLLEELEQRIRRDRCESDCVGASNLQLQIRGSTLTVTAEIHAKGDSEWPIPGPVSEFIPTAISIDGQESAAIRRDNSGMVRVKIPTGRHSIVASGQLAQIDSATLQFGHIPGHVSIDAPGWEIDGVSERGGVGASIQATQIGKKTANADRSENTEVERELPQFFQVQRTISVQLPWNVITTVFRLTASDRAAVARVKLLEGESITEGDVKVEGGLATVSFPRGVNSLSWSSSFSERDQLVLKADDQSDYSESWILVCSSVFSCSQISGIAPLSNKHEGGFGFTWSPWPNEEVVVGIKKPVGTEGSSLTLDGVNTDLVPGERALEGTLKINARSSKSGFLTLMLPEGAEVRRVLVQDTEKTIRPDGRHLSLPLNPGANVFSVNWRQDWSFGLIQRAPQLSIDATGVNSTVALHVPEGRWLLYTRGPGWGPAVLFWGKLAVVLLLSVLLAKFPNLPLTVTEWILLNLGLVSCSSWGVLVPVIWFVALEYRSRAPSSSRWRFNLVQISLIVLSWIAFGVLFDAVRTGLIFSPDMGVSGNGSTQNLLRWYQDSFTGNVAQPFYLSVSIWFWRGIMLLWSVWLAFALLRWLKWGWGCYSSTGLWRHKQRIVKAPIESAP